MNELTRRGAIASTAMGVIALSSPNVAAQDVKTDEVAKKLREELRSTGSQTDEGVSKEIHVKPERFGQVHVVLSATRREIWLYDVADGYARLIIKNNVPADAITTIVSLKIAKKPFWLWVTNIQGEIGSLGHLTVHDV